MNDTIENNGGKIIIEYFGGPLNRYQILGDTLPPTVQADDPLRGKVAYDKIDRWTQIGLMGDKQEYAFYIVRSPNRPEQKINEDTL